MAEKSIATRGKGRPRLDQVEDIDAAINNAAMTVLVELGDAATVQAVAQAAGLSRKTLYARYPSREHLFGAVVRNLLTHTQPLRFEREPTARASVANYIKATLAVLVRPDALAVQRLLAADLNCDADLKAQLFKASRAMFFDPLEALIAEGVARGEFKVLDEPWTASAIIRLVVSEVISLSNYAEFGKRQSVRADSAEKITAFVLNGIAA